MVENTLAKLRQNVRFGLQQHNIRTLLIFVAVAASVATSGLLSSDFIHLSILASVITYAVITGWWTNRGGKVPSDRFFSFLSMTDATLVGFVISHDGLFIFPAAIFYCMLTLSNLINYGTKKWIKISANYFVGLGLGFFVSKSQWGIESNTPTTMVCLFGLIAYISAYAFFAHRHIFGLLRLNTQLSKEHEVYKRRTYKVSQYLTPTVRDMIQSGDLESLQAGRKRITVFFSDIKGFSSLSEEIESETLNYLLNNYLTEMTAIAAKYRGTIDKFMGDGIMILFGDSKSDGIKADSLRALSMAVDMRRKMKELQYKWVDQGVKKPLEIRMGINTGYCTVGSFGTSHYRDYTALGTHVNLASRLESAAQPGQILISHETWALVKDTVLCRDKGEIAVKGFSHPIKCYQVVDFRKRLGKSQTYYEENCEGFSLHMDLEKIKNYDKTKVLEYLENLTLTLKDR